MSAVTLREGAEGVIVSNLSELDRLDDTFCRPIQVNASRSRVS
jgi:hypothetical protein